MKKRCLFLLLSLSFALMSCQSGPEGPQGERGEKGETGQKGSDGRGVVSVVLTSFDGKRDTYTITYTDGSTSVFYVTNGEDGIQGEPGEDGHTPVITIGDNGNWLVDGVDSGVKAQGDKGDQGEKGDKGDQGEKGDPGVSVLKIEKTSSDGNVDTYTITYSDKTTSTFTVSNGKNGHSPEITIGDNGNFYIDGVDSGVKAQGNKGDKGDTGVGVTSIALTSTEGKVDIYTITFSDGSTTSFSVTNGTDGKSAYEIYKENHPEYEGTESQWIEGLVNGNLREKYTVKFNTNGGSSVEMQKISYGHLVTRPSEDPVKTGYLFDGWYLNGEPFPFNSYQVYDNLSIYAKWKSNDLTLTLDANGGDVEYNTKVVTYGLNYVLPTPTRNDYTFDGWYYDGNLCPLSGVWNFASQDITLTARWAGTQVTASYQEDENLSFDFDQTQTIVYGYDYSLPVPTIVTGDRFIGWALSDGTLLTDENGKSLKPADFKSDVVLHAVYYIDITTPNQLINLALKEAGSKELSRTYAIQKDLDFTGMQTQPIADFEGVLDGNGHKIIGLGSPLFSSVGRTDTSKAVIKNIVFESLSAECIVKNVTSMKILSISNISIDSFDKDKNDYVGFNGLIAQVGNAASNERPESLQLNNVLIKDKSATIESGFLGYLSFYKNISINMCSNVANCKKSVFISSDFYSSSIGGEYYGLTGISPSTMTDYSIGSGKIEEIGIGSSINVSYCSNYGSAVSLISSSSGISGVCYTKSGAYYRGAIENTKHIVYVDNVINYGSVNSLFINTMYNDAYATNWCGGSSYSVSNYDGYYKSFLDNTFVLRTCLNFGTIKKIFDSTSTKLTLIDRDTSIFTASYIFNAGNTASGSADSSFGLDSFYNFTPLTNCLADGGLEITSYSQVNSDFFENTFGLDPEKWNLDYINLKDEYGLPTINY